MKLPSLTAAGSPRSRGVALVITLILLAIITTMAIAFLVLSRAGRSAAATGTDQTIARMAADTAMDRAQAELLANIIGFNSEFNFGTLVSTNYINPLGFLTKGDPNVYTSPTNVSYTYANGAQVTGNDVIQNIANLWYNARPPVFVRTNNPSTGLDFRFFINLNRNQTNGVDIFDPTGWLQVAEPSLVSAPQPITNFFVGDPQWIGGLEFPDRRHSPENRFLFRYAYLVAPVGQTLDINYLHNYAKGGDLQLAASSGDGFLRNQGVGTWEMNLAAFLVDLNTNYWPFPENNANGSAYYYNTNLTMRNTGTAFDDALSLVRYRYNRQLSTLLPFSQCYPGGVMSLMRDFYDGYSAGPLMLGTHAPLGDPDAGRTDVVWSGADNTNHFFSTQELFDRNKTAIGIAANVPSFSERLLWAGNDTNSSYNRYTFYRLISQLGTDSAYEPSDKLNLNYINAGGYSATNFVAWDAPEIITKLGRPGSEIFFTNAVERLFRKQGFAFGVNRIPVFTNGVFAYTPGVHRLLQLAANVYDSMTNRTFETVPRYPYPTIFKPLFLNDQGNIYITDFKEVRYYEDLFPGSVFRDLVDTNVAASVTQDDLIYGVPLIVGARKGLPNFNEFALQSTFEITRKAQLTRASNTTPRENWRTNLMYVLSVSNAFGANAWNSYAANYTRPVTIIATNIMSMAMTITNEPSYTSYRRDLTLSLGNVVSIPNSTNAFWPGIGSATALNKNSLIAPLNVNLTFQPDAAYRYNPPGLWVVTNKVPFEATEGFPLLHVQLAITNRLLFVIMDKETRRLLDYVQLGGLNTIRDLNEEIKDPDYELGFGGVWSTNRMNGPGSVFQGLLNQIQLCVDPSADTSEWDSYSKEAKKQFEIDTFRDFYNRSSSDTRTEAQVPFSPTRRVSQRLHWQINDPLVHYTANDLVNLAQGNGLLRENLKAPEPWLKGFGEISSRYNPWGGNQFKTGGTETAQEAYNMALKDPLVNCSDAWDFPTNKFPNVGWLGRVHRGTPWQTVYLKATDVVTAPPAQGGGKGLDTWKKWCGNRDDIDALVMAPTNDWRLLEVFTAALNENASRGQLSINQPNYAAWSAVFGGAIALQPDTNATSAFQPATNFPYVVVEPMGSDPTNSPLWQLVTSINNKRQSPTYNGSFKNLGDILSVPELTEKSPFLNLSALNQDQRNWGISDAVYERLPEQALGLLKIDHSPRFVIYSYGQALKPANRSLVTSGSFLGLCTNYQVTAEVATRAVVRVEGVPPNPPPGTPRTLNGLRAVVESYNVLPPD